MALPIEDYAMIGDRRTAALVGTNGSVDWLCLPNFDSAACLAGLLGTDDHGHWQLVPDGQYSTERRYVGTSAVLETTFTTSDGVVTLTDLMPRNDDRADLVRKLRGIRGTVRMRHEWRVRLDYGLVRPWVRRMTIAGTEVITAIGGPDQLVLFGPRLPVARDDSHNDEFEVAEGDELVFSMTWFPSYAEPSDLDISHDQIEASVAEDEEWAARFSPDVPHADAVRRSLLTLRLMTDEVTGGIVAAPTTSLPERIGGVRNWDYRYCWLRDATLTLLAFMDAGYYDEAKAWREWLVRAVAGSPEQVQIMYGIAGERRLPEWELAWLPGYEGSAPVRVGNAAAAQLQLDVYGEVLDALYQGCKGGLARHDASWDLQRAMLSHLEKVWMQPDKGIWEMRGPPRHFTYSKVMCWVAFDRAVKMVEGMGLPGPVEKWRELRERIHEDVCKRGFSARRGCFVQCYGSEELDGALLLIPITGFLSATDPRMVATVDAIQRELTIDGLVQRYLTQESIDGLPPGEGVFLACSFWLADNLCLQGRWDEARELFERLLGLTNDVGLLAEEYDPVAKRFLGNFPQAFSHVALVNTAMNLGHREKPAEQRAEKKAA